MDEWITIIQTVGFPVFVTVWFMFKTEKALENNTKAIQSMEIAIRTYNEKN